MKSFFIGALLLNSISQSRLELKLLETSHFVAAASLSGFKVTTGEGERACVRGVSRGDGGVF